ncbi:MAG: agmatine deiminase family protein [Polyangiaceae bacterium]|nr:agmatine deiminase family protein [Myxococcales bacterium]MCB9584092.1 agmatine deiminase family protein [Polyangiaceae bacterium]
MQKSLCWFVVLSGCACAPTVRSTPVSEPDTPAVSQPSYVKRSASRDPALLRGDWEAPSTLLIGWDSDWSEAVETIVAAGSKEVQVDVLFGEDPPDDGYEKELSALGANVIHLDLDTPWVRDYGPLQIHTATGESRWLDAHYSFERARDDQVPQLLAPGFSAIVESMPLEVDGGAVIGSGDGLCAITDRSLADAGLSADDPDMDALLHTMGCDTLAVLPNLADETTGHADVMAQFTAPDRVMVSEVDAQRYPTDAAVLDEAVRVLQEAAASRAKPLAVVRVPMHINGKRYYSYVNGTPLKGHYLAPSFRTLSLDFEAKALAALGRAVSPRKLVTVPADAMVHRGGVIHCITLGLKEANAVRELDVSPGDVEEQQPL